MDEIQSPSWFDSWNMDNTQKQEKQEDSDVKKRIILPREMIGKTLFDKDGNCYVIEEKTKYTLGFIPTSELSGAKSNFGTVQILRLLLEKSAKKAIDEWLTKEAQPLVGESLKSMDPFVQKCIAEGERQFRKSFIEKLGAQGAAVWRKILEEQFEEIGKIYFSGKNKAVTIHSSVLLPPGTRFYWHAATKKSVYHLFCIEQHPMRRSISLFGELRRLSFPWIRFFILFKDGVFCSRGSMYAFWVFYGQDSIRGENAPLWFPNLPHIDNRWSHDWCLGHDLSTIRLNDPDWHSQIIGTHFWNRAFIDQGERFSHFFLSTAKNIPEVSSASAWEAFSNNDPDCSKIVKLPWLRVDGTAGQYTVSQFAKNILDEYIEHDQDKKKAKDPSLANEQAKDLVGRLGERLSEELHFLGAHFYVPVDVKKMTTDFLDKSLSTSGEALNVSLAKHCEKIAQETTQGLK